VEWEAKLSFHLPMELRDVLAMNLRHLRKIRKMSQEDLGYAADIDRTYVSSIERAKYATSIDVLGRLAAALEVDPTELLRQPSTQRRKR
jgi:transcriptional regulator with XRE-family HTH domain